MFRRAVSESLAVALFLLLLAPRLTVPQSVVPENPETPVEDPLIIGWGGSRLIESETFNETHPPSMVFAGEMASNQEVQARTIRNKGLNALRVSFAPFCTEPSGFMSPYSSTRLERAIRIAEALKLWIIIDYHGHREFTNSTARDCWLEFWKSIVLQFKDRYERIIWEPLNEPADLRGNMTWLSSSYQRWIDQARALGDKHWVVVQNLCSYGCQFTNLADGFPIVADPLEKVFISIHPYMSYRIYHSSWDNATAETLAQRYYEAMRDGVERTQWSILNTEGGPGRVARTEDGVESYCSDLVLAGSAGFCKTNFRFVDRLNSLLDSHPLRRISRIWWPTGDWTDTPGSGVLGALAPGGWGDLLETPPVSDAESAVLADNAQRNLSKLKMPTLWTPTFKGVGARPPNGES